ncbi:ABC transporter permease subunit [Campylobacter sp. RM15925]|uniref:ABC transporter permease n=1 Tax=Campylobacter sp. RM15925 TaxID=1705724 RepID=UPI001476253B|nr:ABC transporter permease subunit [Campylobacter sp. RM15925]
MSNQLIKQFTKNYFAMFGLFIVLVLIVCAIFAPLIAPFDPNEQNLAMRLLPPIYENGANSAYILGTDDFGRDLLSRIIYGARVSIMIGFISVVISLAIGLLLGILAGYYGGLIDLIIMRIVDIMLAIPAILLAIVIVAILGPSLYNAMIAIGIVGIPTYARIIRASVLAEKEKEYVIASRINGSSDLRLMLLVILPNCLSPIIVQATMGFASAVLEAAGLSFLGLGAQPPLAEWGAMLSNSLQYITTAPWMILYPGLAIFLTVLGFNLIGDALTDALDPKLRSR